MPYTASAVSSFRGAILNTRIPATLTKQLREFNQREGATLFTTLLAGFNIVLSRYSGQEDIVIGTPVADRRWTETERPAYGNGTMSGRSRKATGASYSAR